MHRPLWQILLPLFVLAFVLRRAAVVLALGWGEGAAPAPALIAAYGLQAAAGVATALGIWLGRRWVLAALGVLGASVAGTALVEAFVLDLRPGAFAMSTVLVALLATGALYLVLRHEFGSERGTGVRSG